jgi:hypothetical protein
MIHVIETSDGVEVWTDCEARWQKDGRIVGLGSTRRSALDDAVAELQRDVDQARELLKKEAAQIPSRGIEIENPS